MDPETIEHPIYVDSDEQLGRLCQQWSTARLLALDTEFIRTDTFFPIAGLLQVSDGSACYLLDPLAIQDFTPFAHLLEDQAIIKVLHSCSEDLEVFDCLFGVLPQPLFDTQIGAALAGMDFSMSYQRLCEALLQQHVPKGETRSNWLRRPLTASQIHYAALDVAYLPAIYDLLTTKLQALGRYNWWLDDCQAVTDRFCDYLPAGQYYTKIKSAWKLAPSELALLQLLASWREQEARLRDVPRGRILKDNSCTGIATRQPQTIQELSLIEDLSPKTLRKEGDAVLAMVKQAQAIAPGDWPAALPRPLPLQAGSLLKNLKALAVQRATELAMPQEMLVRKKDYEVLLRDRVLPATLEGWRKDIIGDELLVMVLA